MRPNAPIPLVIIEEHHEAFCIWHNAVWRDWIPAAGNMLLHVDTHSDLRVPTLGRPIPAFLDPADVALFTYEELGIGTFIWPAVVEGLLTKMLWLQPAPAAAHSDAGQAWITTSPEVELHVHWGKAGHQARRRPDRGYLEVTSPAAHDAVLLDAPFILDIDLDYFACHRHAHGRFEVEVTQAAYEEFVSNPYHFLRLSCWDKVAARSEGGRRFLRFGGHRAPAASDVDTAAVHERGERMFAMLAAQRERPLLITLCRSIHSGYTPRELAADIETMLLERLSSMYDIDPIPMTDLIPPTACRLAVGPATDVDRAERIGT
jgi:hypothetical protein